MRAKKTVRQDTSSGEPAPTEADGNGLESAVMPKKGKGRPRNKADTDASEDSTPAVTEKVTETSKTASRGKASKSKASEPEPVLNQGELVGAEEDIESDIREKDSASEKSHSSTGEGEKDAAEQPEEAIPVKPVKVAKGIKEKPAPKKEPTRSAPKRGAKAVKSYYEEDEKVVAEKSARKRTKPEKPDQEDSKDFKETTHPQKKGRAAQKKVTVEASEDADVLESANDEAPPHVQELPESKSSGDADEPSQSRKRAPRSAKTVTYKYDEENAKKLSSSKRGKASSKKDPSDSDAEEMPIAKKGKGASKKDSSDIAEEMPVAPKKGRGALKKVETEEGEKAPDQPKRKAGTVKSADAAATKKGQGRRKKAEDSPSSEGDSTPDSKPTSKEVPAEEGRDGTWQDKVEKGTKGKGKRKAAEATNKAENGGSSIAVEHCTS